MSDYKLRHPDQPQWNALIQASGKLVLIDKLLPKLKDGGHKVQREGGEGGRYMYINFAVICNYVGAHFLSNGEVFGYFGGLPSCKRVCMCVVLSFIVSLSLSLSLSVYLSLYLSLSLSLSHLMLTATCMKGLMGK